MSEEQQQSVFTDDSGTRARWVQWAARGLLGLVVLAGAAVLFSLLTSVTLPGLDGPVHLPGTSKHKNPAGEEQPPAIVPGSTPTSTPTGSLVDSTVTAATTGSGSTGRPGAGPTGRPSSRPTSGPTATPTTHGPTAHPTRTPNPKSNASSAPRATPTHVPGSPAPTPPGKAK